jgi:lipopolysaccharide export system protein LptC
VNAGTAGATTIDGADLDRVDRAGPERSIRRLVRGAKWVLLLAVVGLAVLVAVWSRVNLEFVQIRLSDSELAPEEIDSMSMENARFAGIDERDRKYTVTADLAKQSPEDPDAVNLDHPRAEISLRTGEWVEVVADRGRLQRSAKLLDLGGAITVRHSDGFELQTTHARLNIETRTAAGDEPIEGSGPLGRIRAEGFQVLDDGKRILYLGRTHLIVYNERVAP